MSAMPKLGPWTVDDIPEDDHHYEIVDGELIMVPSPSPRHQGVSLRLYDALGRAIDRQRLVLTAGVIFAPTSYREPDLAVLREGIDLWTHPGLGPSDVVLAVEIVSPSSVTTDRTHKRRQYAAEGIGHYWIVETDPELSMVAFSLPADAGEYAEVGRWQAGDRVRLEAPFAVDFSLDELRG